MKKWLFIGLFALLGSSIYTPAKAAVPQLDGLFGLGDPSTQISYYDVNSVWKYYCFGPECYDITTDKLAFVKDIEPKIADLQKKVDDLTNTVTQLQNQPAPVVAPVVVPTAPVAPATPADVTAPKFSGGGTVSIYYCGEIQAKEGCPNNNFSFTTDEPTTAVVKIYKTNFNGTGVLVWEDYLKPFTGDSEMRLKSLLAQNPDYPPLVTLTDNNLSTTHKFLYSTYNPEPNTSYGGFVNFTDASGNQTGFQYDVPATPNFYNH